MQFLTSNPAVFKVASGFLVASLLDRYVMGVEDVKCNAAFGCATGLALGIGLKVSSMIPMPIIPLGNFAGVYQSKTVVHRFA